MSTYLFFQSNFVNVVLLIYHKICIRDRKLEVGNILDLEVNVK